jgi:hypothetical protein
LVLTTGGTREVDMQGAIAPSTKELRYARGLHEPLVAVSRPPKLPRLAGGLSGRPFGRIYPAWGIWLLELHPTSGGWLPTPGKDAKGKEPRRLPFPTLQAAISYAERHGIDYRVVRPRRQPAANRSKRTPGGLPKSWLARLRRNSRNGEMYHG